MLGIEQGMSLIFIGCWVSNKAFRFYWIKGENPWLLHKYIIEPFKQELRLSVRCIYFLNQNKLKIMLVSREIYTDCAVLTQKPYKFCWFQRASTESLHWNWQAYRNVTLLLNITTQSPSSCENCSKYTYMSYYIHYSIYVMEYYGLVKLTAHLI